jgi:hypothetical protein
MPILIQKASQSADYEAFLYPEPESNRHASEGDGV